MRVWVDLGNSPHVALFGEIVDDLRQRGDDVFLTARDHAQTVGLALERWSDVVVVGGRSPTSLGGKAAALGGRARDLARLLRNERPDAALSHGSYAQALVAVELRPQHADEQPRCLAGQLDVSSVVSVSSST